MNATCGNAQIVQGELVTGNCFEQLRMRPRWGGQFCVGRPDGAAPVALLMRRFGSERRRVPGVVGRTIKVNMVPVTIVGVTPRGFTGASNV